MGRSGVLGGAGTHFGFLSVCSPPGPGGPTLHLEAEQKEGSWLSRTSTALSTNGPGCEARCQQGLRDPHPVKWGSQITIATAGKGGHPAPLPCCPSGVFSPHIVQTKTGPAETGVGLPAPRPGGRGSSCGELGRGSLPHLLGAAVPQTGGDWYFTGLSQPQPHQVLAVTPPHQQGKGTRA